jgi:DNA primase
VPDQVVQDIKDRLSVADVVGSYVQLKRAGANFKAVCPFHHEKTPSFQVSPARQVWHCFGCGEGGDIFDFVERYENVGFAEALKILADRAGVKLPERTARDPQAESERETLVRINSYAAKLYHEVLLKDPKAAPARAYLEKRGLTAETVARWQIGYAPDEFHYLEQALVKKNVPLAALVRAGVSAQGERGQIYDRFRGRITFPILDYFGHVVGFSARILDPDAKIAKYINSPETPIYSKGRVLFGLYQAKQAIRRADDAVQVRACLRFMNSPLRRTESGIRAIDTGSPGFVAQYG